MPILPSYALFVILQSWTLVLQLVSHVWYERQLARYANHWLVKLNDLVDFGPLETGCAGFHADSGRGAPVTHSTGRLVRALLVKYLSDLSLRQTEELIDNHLLTKWFVGYSLFEAPPDHTTLNRFELWVFRQQPRLFFDTIIDLIDRLCPEDRNRLQIVDTFGMQGRAANIHLITLLRNLCRKLLDTLAQIDPTRHAAMIAALDLIALFGTEQEKITPALSAAERAERLQQVAPQAIRLARLLSASLDQPPILLPEEQAPLRLLLAALDKIIADETTVTADPNDPDAVTVVERKHGHKGSYRHGSATDLDLTYRKHDNDKNALLGYNPTVLGTSIFIREIEAATGAEPDNLGLPRVLQHQADQHGFFPDQVAGDMKYGYGKTRAQVAAVSDNQTQVIALIPDYQKSSGLFGPRDFTLSDDGLSLTCPNEVTTDRRYLTAGKEGADFRFLGSMCRDCPLWDRCRGPKAKPTAHRQVFISFYRTHLDLALLFNQTEEFKVAIKKRMHIERLIYNLTNIHGARQAHSYGQPRTDFQLKMQATAFNLRELVRQMSKKRKAGSAAPALSSA